MLPLLTAAIPAISAGAGLLSSSKKSSGGSSNILKDMSSGLAGVSDIGKSLLGTYAPPVTQPADVTTVSNNINVSPLSGLADLALRLSGPEQNGGVPIDMTRRQMRPQTFAMPAGSGVNWLLPAAAVAIALILLMRRGA